MHINLQPTFYNQYSKPAFTSCMRSYLNEHTNSLTGTQVYTTTSLFRNDLDFENLANYITKNFAEKDKVNIKCLAGSDGSEAYSMAISLMEKTSESEKQKYFPILSLDRDETIINSAKEGRINLCRADEIKAKQEAKSGKEYFINKEEKVHINNDLLDKDLYKSYEVIPELREKVKFQKGDLLKEMEELKDDGNSVIMCRNVMPYLHPAQVSKIAYYANENLKPNSLFVIGDFDRNTDIEKYLYYYGFSQVQPNVFKKNPKAYSLYT